MHDSDMILDSETKAVELPEDHGSELRLWLRLLTCTTLIEGEVRSLLRERFDVTLPRFDLMAQLDRVPEGMTLSDVSKRMMVSNGNVTGLVERLVESGHLDRRTSDSDWPCRIPQDGGRARKVDRRHIFRSFAQGCPRIDATIGENQGVGAKVRPENSLKDGVAEIDYEVEYNNRARVPESPALLAGWVRDAAAFRESHQPRRIAYGAGARHVIDGFEGRDPAPIVVFIHGGYWQALEGSSSSHVARGLNAHGISVAIPSYDLCPNVTIQQIIEQMRTASRELARMGRRLVISGHSAGGHLAACMLATDWQALDPSLPKELVIAAYTISGLFDLVPLVETSINKALRLDQATAKAASPLFWKIPMHGSLDAVVGGSESAEYFRQSRTIVEQWGRAGVSTRFGIVPVANHFTAIAPLADPASPMVARLKELAGR
jgi:arylformamidase